MEGDGQAMLYERWLGGIVGISSTKKIALEEQVETAKNVYYMKKEDLGKIKFLTAEERDILLESQKEDPYKLEEEQKTQGIAFVSFHTEKYPKRLKSIYQPPYGLYYRGKLPEEDKKAVALVGARSCSEYGRSVAKKAAYVLADAGVEIISGMAAGIDGAAQYGAIQAQGATYGVLGCGVDICYPKQHQSLYEKIPEKGGIISEYKPGIMPRPSFFPCRNRIISGMADIVLVVEARKKSGSLITADFALEQGKEIYAVPGRLGDKLSEGTNRLIQQGAGIFLGTGELLQEMNILIDRKGGFGKKTGKALENLERLVYSCVDLTPKSLEELMGSTGLSFGELTGILNKLRERGYISEIYKNYFIRTEITV